MADVLASGGDNPVGPWLARAVVNDLELSELVLLFNPRRDPEEFSRARALVRQYEQAFREYPPDMYQQLLDVNIGTRALPFRFCELINLAYSITKTGGFAASESVVESD